MPEHVRIAHPGYALDGIGGAPIPAELLRSMLITRDEELRMNIPSDSIPAKNLALVPLPSGSENPRGSKRARSSKATDTATSTKRTRRQ